jgi:hypothetical protein
MSRYWLFKSEAECFSYKDLENATNQTTGWDGIRNYQARNFLRDDVKHGDGVIYYHSNAEPPGMAGIAVVVEEAHPDPTQFEPTAPRAPARHAPPTTNLRPGPNARGPTGPAHARPSRPGPAPHDGPSAGSRFTLSPRHRLRPAQAGSRTGERLGYAQSETRDPFCP